jgi:hypothetical protein
LNVNHDRPLPLLDLTLGKVLLSLQIQQNPHSKALPACR